MDGGAVETSGEPGPFRGLGDAHGAAQVEAPSERTVAPHTLGQRGGFGYAEKGSGAVPSLELDWGGAVIEGGGVAAGTFRGPAHSGRFESGSRLVEQTNGKRSASQALGRSATQTVSKI